MDAPLELGRVRELAHAVLATLEVARGRLDDLNVYPVPDGDTGTNLTLTVRAAVAAVDASSAASATELAGQIAHAALLGSRGNSGVILSQLVRGFADVAGPAGGDLDAPALARAFRSASDAAYAALREPVEGTILTVARELAEEAERRAPTGLSAGQLLDALVAHGEGAVARTRDQLAQLRDADVVDAGAAGLLEIVRGLADGVAGRPVAPARELEAEVGVDAIHQGLSRYRWCTSFVVLGEGLVREELERDLAELGDSLLVVGDASALKVHVHTDEPQAAVALGTRLGEVAEEEIADMHEQTRRREERVLELLGGEDGVVTGVVAVVAGAGNRALFESFAGTRVVDGGRTMNPATAEILAAVDAAAGSEAVILANDANVVLAAEQAAGQASKPACVVPSTSIAAGVAAVVRYVPTLSAADNATLMAETLAAVSTGEVARATRDAAVDGLEVRTGEWLGLVDGRAVAAGADFDVVAARVVDCALADGRSVLTLLAGEERPDLTALTRIVAARHPDVEADVRDGGQPHYALLVLAE